jgi:hypothetical protein
MKTDGRETVVSGSMYRRRWRYLVQSKMSILQFFPLNLDHTFTEL